MKTTFHIVVDGRHMASMTADFAEASCPILLDGKPTPFQVADAWHYKNRAAELLFKWAAQQGGEIVPLDKEGEPVYEELKIEQATVAIGQMPGGSHYYMSGPIDTEIWPRTKFDTFDEAWEAALKLVPKEAIIVRDAKVKRKHQGD